MFGCENEKTRKFAKKTSFNMKNYSSLYLGDNDNIREIYERSKSNTSNKSWDSNPILNLSY